MNYIRGMEMKNSYKYPLIYKSRNVDELTSIDAPWSVLMFHTLRGFGEYLQMHLELIC